ncbi:MAG: hypothetical protein IJY12_00825 [Clostridia bacterium]|nr:hypothetical protein [Clostridia bacterium]
MSNFRFSYLDKAKADPMLPALFDLLYENMSKIAPTEQPYETDRDCWLSSISPALQKAPRQILLMYDGEELAGYLQYYVNNGVFMVEEVQVKPDLSAHASSLPTLPLSR